MEDLTKHGIEALRTLQPCELKDTSRRNAQAPIIIRVCREAAVAVREAGSKVMRDGHDRLLQRPIWIQPKRDKVFQSYFQYSIWEYLAPFQLLNRRFGLASSITAYNIWSFEATMYYQWELKTVPVEAATMAASQVAGLEHITNVPNGEIIPVVLLSLSLPLTEAAALSSGLFGLLGDEPVQLVDVCDDFRLQAYFHLLRYHGPKEGQASFGGILPMLLNPASFSARIQTWKRSADLLVLIHMWLQDKHTLEEKHKHAGGGQPLAELYSAWDPPYSNDGWLILGEKRFDETSTWVARARMRMWQLQPQIMFRFCRSNCHLYR